MPLTEASDQLRSAVAVQSLRQALQVYDRDSYPAQWASAQLNLANALQYLPSTHPEENLTQAVELYEDLLAARSPQLDPLGYARLLANQGNALAHLGIFDHATAKLAEAQRLFEQCGEWETAVSVRELLTGDAKCSFMSGSSLTFCWQRPLSGTLIPSSSATKGRPTP
jgi:tetratricopeptide (TPR) repeat protein